MNKLQSNINEMKTRLKDLRKFAVVLNQREFPTRNAYPACVLFVESDNTEIQGISYQEHRRTASIVVAIFAQGTPDSEKIETELSELVDVTIKQLAKLTDPLSYISHTSTTYGIQELDPDFYDGSPMIHRAEMRFNLQYCIDFKPFIN